MFYVALEYLSYVFVVIVLGAVLFGTSALIVVSQEGAKHLAANSRKVAERTVQLAQATIKSAAAVNLSRLGR
ncbi:MAG TPA: hypothetical protein VG204_05005 [Terriglobia bacterium]|nr:hypothetical protein [Terriglobia bacterium]